MYYIILFLPLLSAITAGFFGRYLGAKGAGVITTACIMITSLMSWFAFYEVGLCASPVYVPLWKWVTVGTHLDISLGLIYDSLTVTMLVLVTTVSSLVHLYSTSYMDGDPHLPRFMSYLSLFTFSMVMLVTADSYLFCVWGWESVGICSYLLINFWYTRILANKSAMKAMIVNRIGDMGLFLGLFTMYIVFNSMDYSTVFSTAYQFADETIIFLNMEFHALTVISCFLLIGAVGKSAQLGLHTWLPDAMEGPTPVSALIHAATMVTAGVFLLIRSSPILEYAPKALIIITIVGTLTAFFAASVGLVQNDIKKVIAYSTCSQLGYMVLACGLSNYNVALFHLFTHGFFKALLFLGAGSVIHAMGDTQDMRKLGGLIRSIPYTYSMMLIGSLSLMGFPFLAGFYSKDAILELAYGKYTIDGTFAHWMGTLAALMTAFYSFRLIYLTFLTNTNASQPTFKHSHESPWQMTVPLFLLSIGSIFFGFIFKDAIIGLGSPFLGAAVYITPNTLYSGGDQFIDAEFIDTTIKWIPVIFSISGAILAMIFYHFMEKGLYQGFINLILSPTLIGNILINIYTYLNNKWNFDQIYNAYIARPLLYVGNNITYKVLDRGWIEIIGPYGISKSLILITRNLSSLQSGALYNYAFTVFLSAILYLTFISYYL